MKKYFLLPLIIVVSFMLFGCSKIVIEETIRKFQEAVNNEDPEALKEVMSPESQFYITGEFDAFIQDNFVDNKIPVEYKNLDIDIGDTTADVRADEYYKIDTSNPGHDEVLFVMKKVDNFLSFIFPDWKIYQFYNEGNLNKDDPNAPVWKKIKKY